MLIIDTTAALLSAAQAAAGHQSFAKGALYVVATPIGNLADITLRALWVLGQVDAVACEDTRVAGALLAHLGLAKKPLLALHAHNENTAAQSVLALLAQRQTVAYLSDAGTPAISDPGATLVAATAAAGYRAIPIPGASSVVAALSVAGDPHGHGFTFAGFLPAKGAARQTALAACLQNPGTVALLEAPHRMADFLHALATQAPQRHITVARELTKQFEQVCNMPASAGPQWLAADANRLKGEVVIVLHALAPVLATALASSAQPAALPVDAERCLQALLPELPLKQAVALTAQISGAPRNAIYERALCLREHT